MRTKRRITSLAVRFSLLAALTSCGITSEYGSDNTPTSGTLRVFYDEGLEPHVQNQARTFESQYKNASIRLVRSSENEAVQALYNDSCEAIVISRLLNGQEKKAFAQKQFFPKYSAVSKSGVALIANIGTPVQKLTVADVSQMLQQPFSVKDSSGNDVKITVLFDRKNSAVLHYMRDSLLHGKELSPDCSLLNSTLESINYVAQHKNTIAIIDFAWLSDMDDSLYKANEKLIRFIAIGRSENGPFYYPDQSNFKLEHYPFTRTVYVMRKTGEFTLAKGFESFVAGPKGQLVFLKQGLLPARQNDRQVHVNLEQPDTSRTKEP